MKGPDDVKEARFGPRPPAPVSNLTIPNLLSALRIASVPLLLWLAWLGAKNLFIIVLALALLTDLLDGMLARWLNQRTELGARLDLWADAGVFLSLPITIGLLWPEMLRREVWFVGAALAAYALSAGIAFRKFGGLASYHTWLGKSANVGLAIGALATMIGWAEWPFRAGILLMNLAVIEEIAISLVLKSRRSDIPSFWHSWRSDSRNSLIAGKPDGARAAEDH